MTFSSPYPSGTTMNRDLLLCPRQDRRKRQRQRYTERVEEKGDENRPAVAAGEAEDVLLVPVEHGDARLADVVHANTEAQELRLGPYVATQRHALIVQFRVERRNCGRISTVFLSIDRH